MNELEKIKTLDYKPKLLMHTCCGVCVSYPALYLSQYFDLTLYYNNDNIYPFEEYNRRFEEMERLIKQYNQEKGTNIKIIKTEFDGDNYLKKLEPLKNEPERGKRCVYCYSLRMDSAMKYASENNYDYFTTVMTISRQKDSKVLNEIGEKLQFKYPNVKYFYSDFKKDDGISKGNQLASLYNLYRQNYCGCYYSYQEMLQRNK